MKIDWKKRAEAAKLALQNEIVRWQKRIYDVCRKVYPEVDGGGCDSGDELDFSVDEIEQTFAHLQDALQAKEQELSQWKGAIIDAAVVDWVYTKEHETNPRKAINDLIAWNCKVALDPKVSKPAADLVAQARQQAIAETWEDDAKRICPFCSDSATVYGGIRGWSPAKKVGGMWAHTAHFGEYQVPCHADKIHSASSEARSRTVETTGVSVTSQQSATVSQPDTQIRSLTPPPITTTVVETLSDLQEQIRPPISQKEKP